MPGIFKRAQLCKFCMTNSNRHDYYYHYHFTFETKPADFQLIQGNIPIKELQTRPIEIFMCSIKKRQGYGEAFRWLSQYL